MALRHLFLLLMVVRAGAQSLTGEDVKCRPEQEGERVEVAGITDHSPCISCYCRQGTKVCRDESKRCPSVAGCYSLKPPRAGHCCRECADCRLNATVVLAHGQPATQEASCSPATCADGVITVSSRAQCGPAPCPAPGPPSPGHCCPSCPSCTLGGAALPEGEARPDPSDPCQQCSCSGGRLSCSRPACPVLPCPARLQVTARGACCPSCSRPHSSYFLPTGRCFFREKLYSPGQQFPAGPCTSCTCSAGLTVTCTVDTTTCKSEAFAVRPSCTHRGAEHAHGERWKVDQCTSCSCKLGLVDCSPTACPACPAGSEQVAAPGECCPACRPAPAPAPAKDGVCTVFGDPHYKTFDGKVFNFQGSCKYLLTKDCSVKDSNSSSAFSIRITNDARDTVAYSWLRTVTVRLGRTKVSLLQKMRVKVDGRRVALPYIKLGVLSVMRDGYRVILRTNEGARLLWDGVSFLELTVPPKMQGQMCGLCGNYNGSPRDDLTGRHGALLPSGQEFGNSWRVGGRRACSVLPRDVPPPSLAPPCDSRAARTRSEAQCAALRSSLFQPCHGSVAPGFHQAACRTDMCECPGSQCHCEVLTAYARACERRGVRIPGWREETGCKHVLPFKYSGEVVTSAEVSSDVNATLNEVVQEDEADEEGLGRLGQVGTAYVAKPSEKEKARRKEKEKEWRRREKARRRKARRREKKLARKLQLQDKSRGSLGSWGGLAVARVAGGRGLQWGGGRAASLSPPPFDMLLSSMEEGEGGEEGSPTPAPLLKRQGRGRLPRVPPPPPPRAGTQQPERDWKRRWTGGAGAG